MNEAVQDAKFMDSIVFLNKDIRSAPDEEMVCYCSGVSKGDILRSIAAGARSLDDIKAATGACTEGRCREKSPRGR